MKLLTKDQHAKLIDNGRRQHEFKGTPDEVDLEPVVKLFYPTGAATWLLTELDSEDNDIAWGLCDLGMASRSMARCASPSLPVSAVPSALASSATVTGPPRVPSRMTTLDDPGFCICCGADADGVEPDARRCPCEACGNHAVCGAEELLLHLG